MCHGGDRSAERPRSHAHGYNAGCQREKERKNEKLTAERLGYNGTTLDEVSIKQYVRLYERTPSINRI